MTSLMVALNAFPFAAICIIVMVAPTGQHSKLIYQAFFEAEKCLPLPLYALCFTIFAGVVECHTNS